MSQWPDGRESPTADILIVADDITGALDTAGCFATPARPVKVWLEPPSSLSGSNAIDLDSRDLGEAAACRRVAAVFARRDPATPTLAFKKVDSVMRGHPVAEAVAAFRAGRFRRALFAPAFPAMGRVTAGGRQHVVAAHGATPVGPALVDALTGSGVPAALLGDAPARDGFLVADASTDAGLAAAVAAFRASDDDLYVGSGGLASVLAAGQGASTRPPALDLAICGTCHPVTLRQIAAVPGLKAHAMDGSGAISSEPPPFMLVAPSGAVSEAEARRMIERSLERLVAGRPPPRAVLVTGGWTLRVLARICAASHLLCEGLSEPGVAMSRMVAGAWDGTVIVSKSGGFGGDDLLARLLLPGKSDSEPA